MSEQDILLWNAFLNGDAEAYHRIYDLHSGSLFRFGQRFTSDRELIKDCLHDVFVKIYAGRTRLNATDNIGLYLQTALRNTLLNALKKAKKQSERDADKYHSADPHLSPEQEFILEEGRRGDQRLFAAALSSLTDRQREAVYYRYVEERKIDEIAALMGMNYQSVQNLLQRSIAKAQAALCDAGELQEK